MFGLEDFPPALVEGSSLLGIGDMRIGDQVAQFGKKSGPKLGVFSTIKSDCKLPGQPGTTTENVVCGKSGLSFAEPGDSGAFVVNMDGLLVGLLIGGPVGEHRQVGYVTPIGEVFGDIQTRTGWKPSLLSALK